MSVVELERLRNRVKELEEKLKSSALLAKKMNFKEFAVPFPYNH